MIAVAWSRRLNPAHSCRLAPTGREPSRQMTTAVPQLTPSTMTTAVRSSLRHAPTRPYPPADALWRSGRPGRSRLPTAFKSLVGPRFPSPEAYQTPALRARRRARHLITLNNLRTPVAATAPPVVQTREYWRCRPSIGNSLLLRPDCSDRTRPRENLGSSLLSNSNRLPSCSAICPDIR